jgi:hypothetical protein
MRKANDYTLFCVTIKPILCRVEGYRCTVDQNNPYVSGVSQYVMEDFSGVPRNFFRGVQQIQLRTEDRQNGDLGAVAP